MKLIFILPLLMIPVESGPGVKLKGGSNPSEGNVFVDGKPVCDDGWDDNDAGVVCRMLGYVGGAATPNSATESQFGRVPTNWSMVDVGCSGAETDIRHCRARRNNVQCNDQEAAGVICNTATEVCVPPVYAGWYNLGPSEGKADDRTPTNCIKLCKEKNKMLAGVRQKRCSCGNDLRSAGVDTEATCDSVCPGDSSKICGGKWAISVFSTITTGPTTPTPPPPPPPPGGCCPSLLVTSGPSLGQVISGVYTWGGKLRKGRPFYSHSDGAYCLLYTGNWKVEKCDHGDLKGAVGLIKAPASSLETCPKDVQKWTYYADSDGDGGDVTMECVGVTYLHLDSDFVYYKVEVATNLKMLEGATTTTCRQVKMQAVCEGQRGCKWIDETMCVVTPLQNSCEEPMLNLSKAICDGETDPKKCDKLEGVFQYVQGWSGGDQGLVGGKSVKGKDHISGDGDKKLFAYCAKPRAK